MTASRVYGIWTRTASIFIFLRCRLCEEETSFIIPSAFKTFRHLCNRDSVSSVICRLGNWILSRLWREYDGRPHYTEITRYLCKYSGCRLEKIQQNRVFYAQTRRTRSLNSHAKPRRQIAQQNKRSFKGYFGQTKSRLNVHFARSVKAFETVFQHLYLTNSCIYR